MSPPLTQPFRRNSASCEAGMTGKLSAGRWAECGACMVRWEAWVLRSLGAICGTGVPAVLQHLDVRDQLLNTSPLMPRGRGSIEVQQQEVKKPRSERYTRPGNQQREPLVAFPLVSHLLPLHQLCTLRRRCARARQDPFWSGPSAISTMLALAATREELAATQVGSSSSMPTRMHNQGTPHVVTTLRCAHRPPPRQKCNGIM